MDLEKRIEELESQVRALSSQLRGLGHAPGQSIDAPGEHAEGHSESLAEGLEHLSAGLLEDVRRGVDLALGGEPGMSLEVKLGSIWLSRLSALAIMTGVAYGAVQAFGSENLLHWHKIAIGYAGSMLALVYGIMAGRKSRDAVAHTILGTGLAGMYFTTYAAFFLHNSAVLPQSALALPVLVIALMALVCIAHWVRSQTAAGIALFLVYYTVVVSCTAERSAASAIYAFLTCAVLCLVALVFHAMHRWMFFTWAAFIATYLTYIFFFWVKPRELDMGPTEYFWLSNGFLALCYVLFSIACVIDAHKRGEYRRMVAPLAGTNSAVFFTLTFFTIREHYHAEEWMFRLGFAVILTLLALFAETSGPRRNYLFQVFVAKAVILYTLTLQSLLPGDLLLLAMAIECLGLIFSYHRSGIVVFKILNLALMLVTLIGCLLFVRTGGVVDVFGFLVRRNWLCCAGVPVVFAVCAWFYEQFVRGVDPQHRTVSGHWFLADTALDVSSATAAMMHAAAAALILLAVTILDQGENNLLPYLLAGEAIAMAILGLLLFTPQVDAASVLLLVASHVTYYFFLWIGKPGFETQPGYVLLSIAVAITTFLGAFLWERYLYRIEGGKQWEHDLVAAAPYLIATALLTTLCGRTMEWMYAPLAQNGIGVALLLIGLLIHYTGLKTSGLAAFGVGAYTFVARLFDVESPLAQHDHFLVFATLFLLTFVVAEREFALLQRQERIASRTEDVVRTLLLIAANTIGMLGFNQIEEKQYIWVLWLGLGTVGVVFGFLFRESRYRWIGLFVMLCAIARVFWRELTGVNPVYQFLIAAGFIGLMVSWMYSRYGARSARQARQAQARETRHDG
jgi:hypothetical protein